MTYTPTSCRYPLVYTMDAGGHPAELSSSTFTFTDTSLKVTIDSGATLTQSQYTVYVEAAVSQTGQTSTVKSMPLNLEIVSDPCKFTTFTNIERCPSFVIYGNEGPFTWAPDFTSVFTDTISGQFGSDDYSLCGDRVISFDFCNES